MARIDIPFVVDKQKIIQTPQIKIASGGQNYFYAVFDLCKTWGDIEYKKAVFTRDVVSKVMELTPGYNNCMECLIPWEVMTQAGYFDVGIFGGDRLPTSTARVFVTKGCDCDGDNALPPTPDWFTSIESRVEKLEESSGQNNSGENSSGDSISGGSSSNDSINASVQWDSVQDKPFTKVGSSLRVNEGVLEVNTTDKVEANNTLPITSAAVQVQLGNIGVILETI